MKKIAIIGVGNKLMGDDGVGVHAIEYLRELVCHPRDGGDLDSKLDSRLRGNDTKIDLLDGGTGGMSLYHLLREHDHAIIIDAANFGGDPGDVRKFDISQVTLTPDSKQVSLHGTSLAGIIQLAASLGETLPKITLILVQPENIRPSMELSGKVRGSLPRIKDELVKLVPAFNHL